MQTLDTQKMIRLKTKINNMLKEVQELNLQYALEEIKQLKSNATWQKGTYEDDRELKGWVQFDDEQNDKPFKFTADYAILFGVIADMHPGQTEMYDIQPTIISREDLIDQDIIDKDGNLLQAD